jgi:hypothetical protein
MKLELKYMLIGVVIGTIVASAVFIYATSDAMTELSATKAELAISNDYISDLENDLNSCKGDVDFLKNGVEDLISTCTPK